jgi:hypothetical protein
LSYLLELSWFDLEFVGVSYAGILSCFPEDSCKIVIVGIPNGKYTFSFSFSASLSHLQANYDPTREKKNKYDFQETDFPNTLQIIFWLPDKSPEIQRKVLRDIIFEETRFTGEQKIFLGTHLAAIIREESDLDKLTAEFNGYKEKFPGESNNCVLQ